MTVGRAAAAAACAFIALLAGCGGGSPVPPASGVPPTSLDDVLRAYPVSLAATQSLVNPGAWTAAVTPTRLIVGCSAGGPGYSAGRVRDGAFNAHGSFLPFDQSIDLRAAYTSSHIYLYARWEDHSQIADTARDRWYWGAGVLLGGHFLEPAVASAIQRPLPEDSLARHLDEDSLMLMFPIGDPGSVHDGPITAGDGTQTANEAGVLDRPFSRVGCMAACHTGLMRMSPAVGRVDVWNWRAGTSNPLGYALDESGGGSAAAGRMTDGGARIVALNGALGPAVEYDPASGPQRLTHPVTGATLTVDPMTALLSGHTRPFAGAIGQGLFEDDAAGFGCARCHGARGAAGSGGAPPLASFARAGLDSQDYRARLEGVFASATASHYTEGRLVLPAGQTRLTRKQIDDLAAYLAVLPPTAPDPSDGVLATGSGVAGVILTPPKGNAANIIVLNASGEDGLTGVYSAGTATYTVVLRRALDTGYPNDDVRFTGERGERVPFGIAVSDGDRRNHAGSPLLTLEFVG